MRFTGTSSSPSRRLVVEWLEQPGARPQVIELRAARRQAFVIGRRLVGSRRKGQLGMGRFGQASAFTLLELMVVVAIIGFLAAVTLPHVSGFNRANTVTAATRQLLDDVARARSRALANRSVVYMVFLPDYSSVLPKLEQQVSQTTPQLTNLLGHQYAAYALMSARTVGDQPGQHYPHYLTEWQTLPSGIYFWPHFMSVPAQQPNPLLVSTTNTLNGTTNADAVYLLPTNSFPFPSVNAGTSMNLPYIAFSPNGTLVSPTNEYIMLSRGSIFYATDTNGTYVTASPNIVETPPGNAINNPCMIRIDWLTARGTIVQNQFQ